MVKSPEIYACTSSDENESSDEKEEDVRETISVDGLIMSTAELNKKSWIFTC